MRRHPALVLLPLALLGACGSSPPPIPMPPPTAAIEPPLSPPPALPLAQTGIEESWMDPSADACRDFFAYACGGFVRTAAIPSDRATWGTAEAIAKENEDFLRATLDKAAAGAGGDPLLKKIGDYFAACTDEGAVERAGAAPIQPLLAVVAKVKDGRTLADAVTQLHAAGVFPLFEIEPMQDFKDATQMIAGLDQSGIGLPDRDYYLKDEGNTKEMREFYAGHVGRMLALTGMRAHAAKAAVADVMRIETKIAKLEQDKVTRRDPYKVYHRVDRAGLAQAAKTFPWDTYFAGLGFPGVQAISVNDPVYFAGIDALMHEERPDAWRRYLAWQVVRAKARLLSKAFVDEAFAMRHTLTGQQELEPRWKRCVRDVDDSLGELLAQPYVAAKFAGDSKERAQALVRAIDTAMKRDLESLPWMHEETRKAALAKLDRVRHEKVGYPDKWRSYDFEVTRTAYAQDAMAAQAFEQRRQLAKIGKPVDRTEWAMTPPTVNAYYDPSMNEIVLPAGELQPPFFSKDFYAPVNIGDEGGSTIGHELTHGFDDQGSQFDGEGNLRDWWSKETKARFDEATKCVQDQYSQYEAVPGLKINGALTSGENIADIGGVKLGYAALQAWEREHPEERRTVKGFSDEQLYFLAYAQGWCSKETPQILEVRARSNPHSPAKWRVNGPMADAPAFAQAFRCAPGTPMNPGNVCSVW